MNIVFCHHNCTMKYESSISSSFPFNKTSVHFIFEKRLDLNYFDFFWPNFGECYEWESEALLKPSKEIKGCILGMGGWGGRESWLHSHPSFNTSLLHLEMTVLIPALCYKKHKYCAHCCSCSLKLNISKQQFLVRIVGKGDSCRGKFARLFFSKSHYTLWYWCSLPKFP